MSSSIDRFRSAASPFDTIRQTDDQGREYWSARDLAPLMGYEAWHNFQRALDRAMMTAQNLKMDVTSQFNGTVKRVPLPQGGSTNRQDYELSRFAAYLTAMNGDPRKHEVAAAQAYFAVQTRAAETAQPVAGAVEPEVLAAAVSAGVATAMEAVLARMTPATAPSDDLVERVTRLEHGAEVIPSGVAVCPGRAGYPPLRRDPNP